MKVFKMLFLVLSVASRTIEFYLSIFFEFLLFCFVYSFVMDFDVLYYHFGNMLYVLSVVYLTGIVGFLVAVGYHVKEWYVIACIKYSRLQLKKVRR